MTETIFEQKPETSQDQTAEAPQQEQPTTPVLDSLVGEDKKFKDIEALAASKVHADTHINKLEQELADLRAELNTQKETQKILDERTQDLRTPDVSQEEPQPDVDLASLVRDEMNTLKQEELYVKNVREVEATLIETQGSPEAAVKFLNDKASELGVDSSWLKDMAMKSPTAALKALGVEKAPAAPAPSTIDTGTNTSAMRQVSDKERNKAYYDDMRKNDLKRYLSPEVQNERMKKAMAGEL